MAPARSSKGWKHHKALLRAVLRSAELSFDGDAQLRGACFAGPLHRALQGSEPQQKQPFKGREFSQITTSFGTSKTPSRLVTSRLLQPSCCAMYTEKVLV